MKDKRNRFENKKFTTKVNNNLDLNFSKFKKEAFDSNNDLKDIKDIKDIKDLKDKSNKSFDKSFEKLNNSDEKLERTIPIRNTNKNMSKTVKIANSTNFTDNSGNVINSSIFFFDNNEKIDKNNNKTFNNSNNNNDKSITEIIEVNEDELQEQKKFESDPFYNLINNVVEKKFAIFNKQIKLMMNSNNNYMFFKQNENITEKINAIQDDQNQKNEFLETKINKLENLTSMLL